jgi:hypothetical protein
MADVKFYWERDCLSKSVREEYKKERNAIAENLAKQLAADRVAPDVLEHVLEYVAEGEFAPAFFLKDLTEIGIKAADAFKRAEFLDQQLSQPDCP